jgi:hypothetical protein
MQVSVKPLYEIYCGKHYTNSKYTSSIDCRIHYGKLKFDSRQGG